MKLKTAYKEVFHDSEPQFSWFGKITFCPFAFLILVLFMKE